MNLLRSFDAVSWLEQSIASTAVESASWWQSIDLSWLGPAGGVATAIGLILACILLWALNLFALPGNWLAVLLLAGYAWLGPDEGRIAISFTAVLAAFACASLAEIVEFVAGAFGAKRAGGSRRGTVMAIIGSMVGAFTGAVVGLPVPIIGSVLAAILFAGIGATVGAIYGEWTDGRSWEESWAIGRAAFWGRTFGTLGKISVGAGIVLVAVIAVAF